MSRTNEQWLEDLGSEGEQYDAAINDLRQNLLNGLRRGLINRVNTSLPEFDSQTDDFAQEAILRILDNLHTFAGRSQFTTWASKIAVSVALTELRRKRWQDSSLDGMTDMGEGDYTPRIAADPGPEPSLAVEQADMMATVRRLIDEELTEKQRTALVASVIHGFSTVEVAHRLDMKANAVYKLLHDARLRLKRRLANEGLTPGEIIELFS